MGAACAMQTAPAVEVSGGGAAPFPACDCSSQTTSPLRDCDESWQRGGSRSPQANHCQPSAGHFSTSPAAACCLRPPFDPALELLLLVPIAGTGRFEPCLGSDGSPDIQLNSTRIVTTKVVEW